MQQSVTPVWMAEQDKNVVVEAYSSVSAARARFNKANDAALTPRPAWVSPGYASAPTPLAPCARVQALAAFLRVHEPQTMHMCACAQALDVYLYLRASLSLCVHVC